MESSYNKIIILYARVSARLNDGYSKYPFAGAEGLVDDLRVEGALSKAVYCVILVYTIYSTIH